MTVPPDFALAYEGLGALVARLAAGEIGDEVLREEVDAWRRDDCRGAATLTKAAVLALRYELASEGLREGAGPEGRQAGLLRALGRVEATLEPPEASAEGEDAPIVEVALPEALRRRMPNGRGFRMGELQILFEPHEGPPHAHLSVTHPSRWPTFAELLRAAGAPGGPPPNLWALVPKPAGAAAETAGTQGSRTAHLYILPPEDMLG